MTDLTRITRNLEWCPDGYWRCENASSVSYPKEGNEACAIVEDKSFWFIHRNSCIVECLHQFSPAGAVFDVGGGNGWVSKSLQDAGFEVVLVEPGLTGVQNALKRGVGQVVHSTLEAAGFVPASIPAVGSFDVLEHIQDDREFLGQLHASLVDGGGLYLSVPAYELLWSHEDVIAGHFRRYTRRRLSRLLESSGYRIEMMTYIFRPLILPIFFLRSLPFRLGLVSARGSLDEKRMSADHTLQNPMVRALSEIAFRREALAIRRRSPMNLGSSLLAVARKV